MEKTERQIKPDQQNQEHLQQKIENKGQGEAHEIDNNENIGGLSKKQMKKKMRKQKWEEIKKIKRKEDREKQKIKKQQKRIQQQLHGEKKQESPNKYIKKRKDQYIEKMQDELRVVIDLQFYDLMTEKEQVSLAKQLAYSHSVNRKMQKPFNYIITSLTKQRRDFLSEKYNVDNYGITLKEESILDVFDHQSIVYLTGDAEEEIQEFNQNQVYVIGGIVDHNRLKNITINFANEHKIKARRLPMEGIKLRASVHLAVNHVYEWMLRKYNGQSWGEAIQSVIPQRKLKFPIKSGDNGEKIEEKADN